MLKTPVLMKRIMVLVLVAGFIHFDAASQFSRYIVKFRNKGGTPHTLANPSTYLSQRAIDRRTRYNIAIDSTDLPLTPAYIESVRTSGTVTILNVSKWLNAITIQTSDASALSNINAFAFVESVTGVASRVAQGTVNAKFPEVLSNNPSGARGAAALADYFNYGTTSYNEIHLHNGEFLHNIGLRGQGLQIAMLDNGFNNYTSASYDAFDSVNANSQVLGTWDFVAREQNVANDGSHGMSCFSIIAANVPGQFVGKAPKASFWLYQTEDNASEFPIEEFNWACGAERSDSSGADLISSSLGYGYDFDGGIPDYTLASLDGNTHRAAIAADLAAKKGLLVFVAAGNAGSIPYHKILTPSDGDSVLAVGAVNTAGAVGGFSSYGPSGDGQIKPDVASVGVSALIQTSGGGISTSNGTSFACPNMAGLATCLWQGFPEFNNMRIRSALWNAGSRATNPDDRVGYGIPDMKKAFIDLLKEFTTANGSISNCKTTLNWTSKDVSAMKYELERKAPGESGYSKIADISPTGSAILSNQAYQRSDTLVNVQAGSVSYRIRQVLDTATASFTADYIDTVNINLAAACITTGVDPIDPNEERVIILPNPATSRLTLKIRTPYAIPNMQVNILDMKGASLAQYTRSKSTGESTFTFQLTTLPKGKYIVTIYNGTKVLASKEFVKL
jgi:serine protease AprX